MTISLDDTDRSLIRLLRLDGRRPNSELAAEVGLSASACLRRVRMLEERGVIRGYTAIVAAPDTEGRVIAIVRLTLEKQTEEYRRRFEAAVREHPEIEECYLMTGAQDYLVRVVVSDPADFERLHSQHLTRLPGVARVQSSFALRTVRKSVELPISH